MFSSTISKIWLVGLVIFAVTPVLMSRTPAGNDHTPAAEKTIEAPVKSTVEQIKGDNRNPASEVSEAVLAK